MPAGSGGALLSELEAQHVSDSFLLALYGEEIFRRRKELKVDMKFITDRDYVSWLVDVATHYKSQSDNPVAGEYFDNTAASASEQVASVQTHEVITDDATGTNELLTQPITDVATGTTGLLTQPITDVATGATELLTQPFTVDATGATELLTQPITDDATGATELLTQPTAASESNNEAVDQQPRFQDQQLKEEANYNEYYSVEGGTGGSSLGSGMLSSPEALHVSNTFLHSLYGDVTFHRWRQLKEEMNFLTEKDYTSWLIDVANHCKGASYEPVTTPHATDVPRDDVKPAAAGGDVAGPIILHDHPVPYEGTLAGGPPYTAPPYSEGPLGGSVGVGALQDPPPPTTTATSADGSNIAGDGDDGPAVPGAMSSEEVDRLVEYLGQRTLHQCPHCPYTNKRRDHIRKHVVSRHEKTRAFQCTQCELAFSQPGNLHHHMIYRHNFDTKHRCAFCNKGFASPKVMAQHETGCKKLTPEQRRRKQDPNRIKLKKFRYEGSLQCELCQKIFRYPKAMFKHKETCKKLPPELRKVRIRKKLGPGGSGGGGGKKKRRKYPKLKPWNKKLVDQGTQMDFPLLE